MKKHLLLIIIAILCIVKSFGQTPNRNLSFGQFNFEKESFLIGTLDEYMGHQQTFNSTGDKFYYQMVDIYFQDEKKIAFLIDSLFKLENTDLHINNNGSSKGIKLYSATLSKKVDKYYIYKPSGLHTVSRDTIFSGSLKKDMIKTDEQKLSFLAGVFLRNGGTTDSKECFISIPNSPNKANLCTEFLKELNCKDVELKILNNIPTGYWVFFEPSDKINEIIRNLKAFDIQFKKSSELEKIKKI